MYIYVSKFMIKYMCVCVCACVYVCVNNVYFYNIYSGLDLRKVNRILRHPLAK